MKSVKQIIDELSKFPGDAKVYAYEGEVCGIIIVKDEKQGVIHCSERGDDPPTDTGDFTIGYNNDK